MRDRARTHLCAATLPNGVTATKVTSCRYTAALVAPQVGGRGLWVVLRWGSDPKKLRQEAKRRVAQSHGERDAVVVPVEIIER